MILIVDMNSRPLGKDEFVKPIAKIIGNDYEIKKFSEIVDLNKYDKIILSGTPLQDLEYLKQDFSWIKTYDKPLLGICAGMQVIAKLFRSKLSKCQEIGMAKIKTTKENQLFDGEFEAYELHNYAVTKGDFEILAESEKCIQAIRKNNIYGVMFHPEVRNEEIIRKFCAFL